MAELAPLVAFSALLMFAAASDVATMTIPNWVSAVLATLFVPAALMAGVPGSDVAWHVAFGLVALAGGFVLFAIGVLGGGDAKLIAAAAVWTGAAGFGQFALWTALAGGLLAASLFAARLWLKPADARPAFVNRLLKTRGGVPYGVAIMAGGLAALGALPFAEALTLP